jgi:hypothetical protein
VYLSTIYRIGKPWKNGRSLNMKFHTNPGIPETSLNLTTAPSMDVRDANVPV